MCIPSKEEAISLTSHCYHHFSPKALLLVLPLFLHLKSSDTFLSIKKYVSSQCVLLPYSKQKFSFCLCFCLQFLQFNNGHLNPLLHHQHRIAAQQLVARQCNLKLISQQYFRKTIVLEEFLNVSHLSMRLNTVRSLCGWNDRSTESYTPGSYRFCPPQNYFHWISVWHDAIDLILSKVF